MLNIQMKILFILFTSVFFASSLVACEGGVSLLFADATWDSAWIKESRKIKSDRIWRTKGNKNDIPLIWLTFVLSVTSLIAGSDGISSLLAGTTGSNTWKEQTYPLTREHPSYNQINDGLSL